MDYKIILSRRKNTYAESLNKYLSDSIIIYDSELPNNEYCCLTETVRHGSAWDKAFYYIAQNKEFLFHKYQYFYFIEDDVYAKDLEIFQKLFLLINDFNYDLVSHDVELKENSKHWNWWNKYKKFNMKSFNPLCRLSSRLVELIINYFISNKKFIFHEVLFASIAQSNNFNTFDFKNINNYSEIFGKFIYRPIIDIKNINDNKIYHPVKPIYENI